MDKYIILFALLSCVRADASLESLHLKLDALKDKVQQIDFLGYAMKFTQVDLGLKMLAEKVDSVITKVDKLEAQLASGNVEQKSINSNKLEEYLRKLLVAQQNAVEDLKQQKELTSALSSMSKDGMNKLFDKIDSTEPKISRLSNKVDILDGKFEASGELFSGLQEQVESSTQRQAAEWATVQGKLLEITFRLRTITNDDNNGHLQLGRKAWSSVQKIRQAASTLQDIEPNINRLSDIQRSVQICLQSDSRFADHPQKLMELESTYKVFSNAANIIKQEVDRLQKPQDQCGVQVETIIEAINHTSSLNAVILEELKTHAEIMFNELNESLSLQASSNFGELYRGLATQREKLQICLGAVHNHRGIDRQRRVFPSHLTSSLKHISPTPHLSISPSSSPRPRFYFSKKWETLQKEGTS